MNLRDTAVVRIGSYAAHYHGHEIAAACLLITCAAVGVRDPRLGVVAVGLALFLLGLVVYDTRRWWVVVGRHRRSTADVQAFEQEQRERYARLAEWESTPEGRDLQAWQLSLSRLVTAVEYMKDYIARGGTLVFHATCMRLVVRSDDRRRWVYMSIGGGHTLFNAYDHDDDEMDFGGTIDSAQELHAAMAMIITHLSKPTSTGEPDDAEPAA
ncbi:hypothetical protein L6V77_19215 [Myxococcota bacterium]|nr:hypothetical protein [Myxococcota bacterium]